MKKIVTFFLLVIFSLTLSAFELKNFSYNNIDYQWDRKERYEEALDVYVGSFQESYRKLGLGDCADHFKEQRVTERRLAEENPANNHWLLAMRGDKVVGVAIFEFDHYPNLYVRELAVLPEYQRQGIGKNLSFGPVRDNSIERVSILTRRANTTAVAFYKALGFKETDYGHEGYDLVRYVGMEWFKNAHD